MTQLLAVEGADASAALAFGEARAASAAEEDRRWCCERSARCPSGTACSTAIPTIPKKAVDMVGDALCCLVHDKNDLTREDLLNATVFIHGKESEPKVVQIGPRYFLTPGELAGRGGADVWAAREGEISNLRFSAFRLDGKVVLEPQESPSGVDRSCR